MIGRWLLLLGCFVFVFVLGACDEPNKLVAQATADGRFKLSLRMERDWVRPGGLLPVRLEIESLDGPLAEEFVAQVELLANNGEVEPSSLLVVFPGPGDAPDTERARFSAWVTFTAPLYTAATADARDPVAITRPEQGEVQALFLDTLTLLRFQIVPAEAGFINTTNQ